MKLKKFIAGFLAFALLLGSFVVAPQQAYAAERVPSRVLIQRFRVNTWRAAGGTDGLSANAINNNNFTWAGNASGWHSRWGGLDASSGHTQMIDGEINPDYDPMIDIDFGGVREVTSLTLHRRLTGNSRGQIAAVEVFTHAETTSAWPNGERTWERQLEAGVPQADIDADFAMDGWEAVTNVSFDGLVDLTAPEGVNPQIVTITFYPPINVRYVRLRVTAVDARDGDTNGNPDYVMISEIQAFGAGTVPAPAPAPCSVQTEITRARVNTWRAANCQWGDGFNYADGSSLFNGIVAGNNNMWHGRFPGHEVAGPIGGSGAFRTVSAAENYDPTAPALNCEENPALPFADIDFGSVQTIGRLELVKRPWNYVHISAVDIFVHGETGAVWPNGDEIGDRLGEAGVPQDDIDADFVMDGWELASANVTGLLEANTMNQTVIVVFDPPIQARYVRIAATFSDSRDAQPDLTYPQLSQVNAYASAVPAGRLWFPVGQYYYSVDNYFFRLDAPAFTVDGRTMVPLRAAAEAMGGEPVWDGATQTATIILGDRTVSVVMGQPLPGDLGTPDLISDRIFVPLRFVATELGATSVHWDPVNSVAHVNW